jgi:hypothetical protein
MIRVAQNPKPYFAVSFPYTLNVSYNTDCIENTTYIFPTVVCISTRNIDVMLISKWKQLAIILTKLLIYVYETILKPIWTPEYRKSRNLPIQSFAHDSGRTFVRAKYGYPKGSPNANS